MKTLTIYHICLFACSLAGLAYDQDGPRSVWLILIVTNATLAALSERYYRDEI